VTRASHRTALNVRQTFESTRLSSAYLVQAYAIVVPVLRRQLRAGQRQRWTDTPSVGSAVPAGGNER
jgi:hypothetical protein